MSWKKQRPSWCIPLEIAQTSKAVTHCPKGAASICKPQLPAADRGVRQRKTFAHLAGIERSHMGKIERGEHMPTLALVFKIARALQRSAGELVLEAEARLPKEWREPPTQ